MTNSARPGSTKFWVGVNKVPVIGTMRVGHVKDCLGLEGDMASSSRCMTFMERPSVLPSDRTRPELRQRRLVRQHLVRRSNLRVVRPVSSGRRQQRRFLRHRPVRLADPLDLLANLRGRRPSLAALGPFGRLAQRVEHDPGSGRHRSPPRPAGNARRRPGGKPWHHIQPNDGRAGFGGQPLPDANANRIIDTNAITCDNEYLLGTELLYIRGPWSFQAEYGWNFLDNAHIDGKAKENYEFNGGYLQVSYMLTGENRHYDKKYGTLSRYYLGGDGPYENAFLVRDALGDLCCGRGAWELALRYSYVDLNSDLGSTDPIKGGIANGVGVALNWYLNTNLSVMTDWNYNYRYDATSLNTTTGVATPINNGSTNGFGTEVQLTF